MTVLATRISQFLQGSRGLISHQTFEAYLARLNRFSDFVGERKVTPLLCKEYMSSMLEDGLSRCSAKAHYGTIQNMFAWLVDAGVVNSNPVPKIRRFVVPTVERDPMTEPEVNALLNHFTDIGQKSWFYATLCGWETGLRLGDVASLRWAEVDQVERTITRKPLKTRRFGKSVTVPISERLLQAMQACPRYEPAGAEWVAPLMAQKHKWDGHKTLSLEFARHAARIGVDKTFHQLRHGLVSRLLNKGVSPAIVQAFTGHSLKQLATYSHVDIETKRAAAAL